MYVTEDDMQGVQLPFVICVGCASCWHCQLSQSWEAVKLLNFNFESHLTAHMCGRNGASQTALWPESHGVRAYIIP
jgi:hypothetical protein